MHNNAPCSKSVLLNTRLQKADKNDFIFFTKKKDVASKNSKLPCGERTPYTAALTQLPPSKNRFMQSLNEHLPVLHKCIIQQQYTSLYCDCYS